MVNNYWGNDNDNNNDNWWGIWGIDVSALIFHSVLLYRRLPCAFIGIIL